VVRDYHTTAREALADPDLVQQVVVNLLANATQALDAIDGSREICISVGDTPDGRVSVVVADNGPGIAADVAARIFEPFFTTKPQGSGTGIGLSVSRGLAQAQGGSLTLIETSGVGAAFELILPGIAMGTDAASAEAADAGPRSPAGGVQRTAIVVDDEAEIAAFLAEQLRRAGYICDEATGGREAQAMIAARAGGYDAVVCDLRMPDIDGPRLFRWMTEHHPALAERTLFITGDALGAAAGRFLAESRCPVIEKPFIPADVVRLVTAFPARSGPARP